MKDFSIVDLPWSEPAAVGEARALVVRVFADPRRYSVERVAGEMQPAPVPEQRRFFVAYRGGVLVGSGGLKSADWASHTHVLYLSVVAPEHRGLGIGRALVKARLDWLRREQRHGRVLVSTTREKRFLDFGFRRISRQDRYDRCLMLLEY